MKGLSHSIDLSPFVALAECPLKARRPTGPLAVATEAGQFTESENHRLSRRSGHDRFLPIAGPKGILAVPLDNSQFVQVRGCFHRKSAMRA
jgi:hypothetical protein